MSPTRAGLAILALLPAALIGCGGSPDDPARAADDRPLRIAVMAPAAAEMLDALDLVDRVIAVGDFVKSPRSLLELPRLGAYNTPNVERVLELKTELLVTTASQAADPAHRRLASLGVTVLALDTSTYQGVFESLRRLGQATGQAARAAEIERSMQRGLGEIREIAAGAAERRVLFVGGRDPLYVAGPGSHIDEMIAMVGASNVAHDAASPYPQLSMEAVLERLPEVIVDTSDNRPDAVYGRRSGRWEQWSFLPAVKAGRVYHVHPERLVIPGMRLEEMTRLLGRLVRPELFGETDDASLGPTDEEPEVVAGG